MISMIRTRPRPMRRTSPTSNVAHGRRAVKRAATAVRSPGAWMTRTYKLLIRFVLTLIGDTHVPSSKECTEIHEYLPPDRVKVSRNPNRDHDAAHESAAGRTAVRSRLRRLFRSAGADRHS